ncbi:MAG: hypothetical protein AB1646_16895 [Thermodesulfobacteriota bacterium]
MSHVVVPVRMSQTNASPKTSRGANQPERVHHTRAAVHTTIQTKPYQGLLIFFMELVYQD